MKPVVCIVVIMFTTISFAGCFFNRGEDFCGLDDLTDPELIRVGIGTDKVQIGDRDIDVILAYGDPEMDVRTNWTRWLSYREEHFIDFLINESSKQVIEIRYNNWAFWMIDVGTHFGMDIDMTVEVHGGASGVFEVQGLSSPSFVEGTDRALYHHMDGNDSVSHLFIHSSMGVLYWFDVNQTMTQIVVFEPY